MFVVFSHRFTYGYLVTTSPRSFTPSTFLVGNLKQNKLPWCDGRCVQDPRTYSPWHADPRLLAIPTSCTRVAEYNPNWDNFLRLAPLHSIAALCSCHCSTCVAQPIRAMMTCCNPHLPPTCVGSPHREPLITCFRQLWERVMLVLGLNHTSHDTSWQQPCSTCLRYSYVVSGMLFLTCLTKNVKGW